MPLQGPLALDSGKIPCIFPSLLRKKLQSNFDSCSPFSPAAVQLHKLVAAGEIKKRAQLRKKKIATAIMIRALLSVLPRSSCVSWSRKARNLPSGGASTRLRTRDHSSRTAGTACNHRETSGILAAENYKRDEKMLSHSFVSMNTPGALELFHRKSSRH